MEGRIEALRRLLGGLEGAVFNAFRVVLRNDDIHLEFYEAEDGILASLRVSNPLTVYSGGKAYSRSEKVYFGILADLLESGVSRTQYEPGKFLGIAFDSADGVAVSLSQGDFRGPEAVLLKYESGDHTWGVWQVGD